MPTRNTAPDTSLIAPFLTHERSFLGQTTLIPPDNNGRIRKQKYARQDDPRPAPMSRRSNSNRRDHEQAQNMSRGHIPSPSIATSGPHLRNLPVTIGRYSDYRNSIPDYPPPEYESDAPPRAAPELRSHEHQSSSLPARYPEAICPSCSCSLLNVRPTSPVETTHSELSESDTGSDYGIEMLETLGTDGDRPLSPTSIQSIDAPSTLRETTKALSLPQRVKRELKKQKTTLASPVSVMSGSSRSMQNTDFDNFRTPASSVSNFPACSDDVMNDRRGTVIVEHDESGDEEAHTPQSQPPSAHPRTSHSFSLLRGGSHSTTNLLSRASPAFFKSTTSLLPLHGKSKSTPSTPEANTVKSPPPSVRSGTISHRNPLAGDGFINRKLLFAHSKHKEKMKARDRPQEPETDIDTWEVLDRSTVSTVSREGSSSLRIETTPAATSTDGDGESTSQPSPPVTPQAATASPPPPPPSSVPHPLSLRDRKVPPPPPQPQRKSRRPPPPPPLRIPVMTGSPPVVTVRMKKPSLPPPAPLRRGAMSPLANEVDLSSGEPGPQAKATGLGLSHLTFPVIDETQDVLELAMTVPLPLTPPVTDLQNNPRLPEYPAYERDGISVPLPSTLPDSPPPSAATLYASSPTENHGHRPNFSPVLSPRHHYAGRPLPRPPRIPDGSVYIGPTGRQLQASVINNYRRRSMELRNMSPTSAQSSDTTPRGSISTLRPLSMPSPTSYLPTPTTPCPEGLLIDLSESAVVEDVGASVESPQIERQPTDTSARSGSEEGDLASIFSTEEQPSSSTTITSSSNDSLVSSYPSPQRAAAPPPSNGQVLPELTDLDLVLSRIEDSNQPTGSDYDAILMISDFIGPASPTIVTQARLATTSSRSPPMLSTDPVPMRQSSTSVNPTSTPPSLRSGLIELQRRRVTKDGRVKLKLSLLGVSVDKCGICFTQFKATDKGALGSNSCQHAFHARCLINWYGRSRTCPICRKDAS